MEGIELLLKGTANNRSRPLSCCFNMANYSGGICHLRTIKPVRLRS